MSFIYPVKNAPITQRFGENPAYYASLGQKGHNGVDWGVTTGTPVYAMDEGTVTFEGWGQNHSWMGAPAGICALINHGGSYGGYAHLSSTVVSKGQRVIKGQIIGYSGATGTATGPHTHSEMLPLAPNFKNGYAGRIDITPYYETSTSQPTGGKLMTEEFIVRTYYMINNQVPSRGEIDFHLAKSTPASFVNGFGDKPLWLAISAQRDSLVNQINDLQGQLQIAQANNMTDTGTIQSLNAQLAEARAALDAKEVELEEAKRNQGSQLKDDDRSLGDLLSAAFRKLFKIK